MYLVVGGAERRCQRLPWNKNTSAFNLIRATIQRDDADLQEGIVTAIQPVSQSVSGEAGRLFICLHSEALYGYWRGGATAV